VRRGAVEGSSRRVPTRSCFLRQAQDKRKSTRQTVKSKSNEYPAHPSFDRLRTNGYCINPSTSSGQTDIPVHPSFDKLRTNGEVRCGAVEGSSRRVPTRSCFLRQDQDKRISEGRTVEVQASFDKLRTNGIVLNKRFTTLTLSAEQSKSSLLRLPHLLDFQAVLTEMLQVYYNYQPHGLCMGNHSYLH